MKAQLSNLSFAFPESTLSIDVFKSTNLGLTDDVLAFLNVAGIEQVKVSKRSPAELAIAAANQLFLECDLSPDAVTYHIHIKSRAPAYLMSSEAMQIQSAVDLSKAISFSMSDLGCVDISVALQLCNQLIEANPAAVILVTAVSTPYTDQRLRVPVTFLGDGAMALLVSTKGEYKLLDIHIDMNGSYWDLYQVDYQKGDWQMRCQDPVRYAFNLALESKMQTEKQFQAVLSSYPQQTIGHYIMHNLAQQSFSFYEELLGVSFDVCCQSNLSKYGHLGPIDILFNLATLKASGRLHPNDRVMLINNSPVAAWSNLLINACE